MQTSALQYKLIKRIKDERFDEESIHQYNLIIHVGIRDFQVAVIAADSRVVVLEDYVLPAVSSQEELLAVLEQIFDSHSFLKAGFWKQIKVSLKSQKFVQVPRALFAEECTKDYLEFNAHVDADKEECLCVSNRRTDAVTIFAIFKDLKQWFLALYPNSTVIFLHQSAALIEGVLQYAKNRKDNPLYIYVDRFKLHVLSCKEGKLIYYNQFTIKQFSDYIRYIMLVMKSLNMDPYAGKVVLWGYIGKNSPHYHEFYKYINNVVFGKRPGYLQFSYLFDEIQDHHFFDLYSAHLVDRI